jgi:hypothetical protein
MTNASGSLSACLALILVIATAIAGCSRTNYELAPVDGTVTIDGRPLTNARIMFAPVAKGGAIEAGKPAVGRLGADGSFTLTTYRDNDGAVVGEHWVTIIRTAPNPEGGGKNIAGDPHTSPAFDRLAVPRTTSVISGLQNHIDIKLSAAEVARFGRLFV